MLQFVLIIIIPMLGAVGTTLLVHGVMLRDRPFYLGASIAVLAALVVNFFVYHRFLYWLVDVGYSGRLLGDQTNVAIGGVVAIVFWLPACVAVSALIWMRNRKRKG